MKIAEVMTPHPTVCTPDTTVAEAARLMWEADCGVLPVVEGRRITALVTDRDMFIALATRDARASELRIESVAHANPVTCSPQDDIHQAMGKMKANRVRRLPVVDDEGTLVGIVSMNDLVLAFSPTTRLGGEVVETLQTISEHPLPVPVTKH